MFSHARQEIVVAARDDDGDEVLLRHPFRSRSAGGTDALLAALDGPERVIFVAGHVHALGPVVLEPTGIVLEAADGTRKMLQPWIDVVPPGSPPVPAPVALTTGRCSRVPPTTSRSPSASATVGAAIADAQALVGALLTSGARRTDDELVEHASRVADTLSHSALSAWDLRRIGSRRRCAGRPDPSAPTTRRPQRSSHQHSRSPRCCGLRAISSRDGAGGLPA